MRARAAVLYAACLPVLIGLVFSLTTLSFRITKNWPWPRMPDWTVRALNVVPPAVAGAAVALLVALLARRFGWYEATLRGHFRRLAIVYVCAAGLTAVIVGNHESADFGLWSQFIQWPLAGLLALSSIDLAITAGIRRHRAPAT